MSSGLNWINALPAKECEAAFMKCCGSKKWAESMTLSRPFASTEILKATAQKIWESLSSQDQREVFGHHPRIGDLRSLEKRFKDTHAHSTAEQSGIKGAPQDVLLKLAQGNEAYEKKFGYLFLVCASGKSAEQMLAMLNARLQNDVATEFRSAMIEQAKITQLRLDKLLTRG